MGDDQRKITKCHRVCWCFVKPIDISELEKIKEMQKIKHHVIKYVDVLYPIDIILS